MLITAVISPVAVSLAASTVLLRSRHKHSGLASTNGPTLFRSSVDRKDHSGFTSKPPDPKADIKTIISFVTWEMDILLWAVLMHTRTLDCKHQNIK